MITHLEDLTNRKIREEIEVKRIFSHRDFIKDYNAYKGTALRIITYFIPIGNVSTQT